MDYIIVLLLLLLLLSHFSRVRLCATPLTEAHQAPLSLGFSRQEYWSGLPCPLPGDLPNPRIKPRSPALQVDSLPSEPPGKPMNTRVGSLSLLQGIFPIQDQNWGLLYCRCILYQLSYQGSTILEAPSQMQVMPLTYLQLQALKVSFAIFLLCHWHHFSLQASLNV